MADPTATEISCDFSSCPTPAVRGGIVAVQPNGLTPAHGIYYACSEHPGILADALETWPVAAPDSVYATTPTTEYERPAYAEDGGPF